MKKLTLLLFGMVIILSACKKTYTCSCNDGTNLEYPKISKKQVDVVKKTCEEKNGCELTSD
jgi:protein involved in sex pheromone biosynthesis